MKNLISLSLTLALTGLILSPAFAQSGILNRIEKKVENRVNRKIDRTVDQGLDEIEDGISGKNQKKAPSNSTPTQEPEEQPTASADQDSAPELEPVSTPDQTPAAQETIGQDPPAVIWSKYDFVPGDKIIFEDDLLNEKNGEFPSKWDLVKGSVENAKFGEENVISFGVGSSVIKPLMKSKSYLTEVFTIEFDIFFHLNSNEAYTLNLVGYKEISIRANTMACGTFQGSVEGKLSNPGWRHVAISFNQRALKCYLDQDRILNIPNIETPPSSITLSALSHGAKKGYPSIIRNIRIAEGGVELYDRLSTDGKIITHGIRFDVGKSSIKPESAGTLAGIVQLMQAHPELNFSIEGHTDSDGSDASNQSLSEARANSVKNELVRLGIDAARLKTKGFGESQPLDSNETPEGKARNRRVEFVKF